MFLTWKVSAPSLSTTSSCSWWTQKHLTVGLCRRGFENSRNSCPTSLVPGLGGLFPIHTTPSVPGATAQLNVRGRWQSCGTGQTNPRSSWHLVPPEHSPVPTAVPAQSLPAPGQDGTGEGKLQALVLNPGTAPQPEGSLGKVTQQGWKDFTDTSGQHKSVTALFFESQQLHLKLLRNPKIHLETVEDHPAPQSQIFLQWGFANRTILPQKYYTEE